jgi:hypothetical protein
MLVFVVLFGLVGRNPLGDTRHQFDPADATAVAEAEVRFKELTGGGFTAANRLDAGKSEVIRPFGPTV